MDVVDTVRSCLARWNEGGHSECRDILAGPHANPTEPACSDMLTTVYHALITSTLLTWNQGSSLPPSALVEFVKSLLGRLPSSSSVKPSSAVAFGELLVDLLWTVDVELDDVHQDAKLALSNAEQGNAPVVAQGDDAAAVLARVAKTKQNAEADKATLAEIVRALVAAGILDPDVCRERLELSLMYHAGLIADDQAFLKKEVRMRTALFYKQNKFNLLREQSEGYSKLTVELTSSLGPSHSLLDGTPVESMSAIEARARPAWERVVGLVGHFDLDPNRALDIILDVFSTHLVTHWSFFLALLSCSPWAPASKQTKDEPMSVDTTPDRYRGKSFDEVLELAEKQVGVPSVPQSSERGRVLAQVLGFKFTYYQGLEVSEPAPRNLYLTAALLIREGFITVEDLYPHISPSDKAMEDVHKAYLASVDSRIEGSHLSALAMAAPLASSESSGQYSTSKSRSAGSAETQKPQTKETPKEVPNQKLGLIRALLSLGVLRPAIALLTKFPWIVDVSPDLADLLIRILHHSISDLHEPIWPDGPSKASFATPRARYATTGLVPPPERRPQLTLVAPPPPNTGTTNFVFFFPQWTDRIPLCYTAEDVADVVEPFLRFIGIHISRDVNFLSKFLRIGRSHIGTTIEIDPETKKPTGTPDPENPIRRFWFNIIRLYLLPALPLIRGNAVCTVEIWNIVRQYDVSQRWRLYGECKANVYKSHPELRVRQALATRQSKALLRRLSGESLESLSGTVAKLGHSDPCILFANIVHQVMAYENFAAFVVKALNYSTVMGFDVLTYIMAEALSNPDKDRVKSDGVNTSDWLQNLCSFIGQLFRRYSADMSPILKYAMHQLHNGQTLDIVVLREVIRHMAGIEPLPNLTDPQITALAGGPHLRIEAIASYARGARLDPTDTSLKGPWRLGRALVESQLVQPLLIQLAQQRQRCVFQTSNAPLKSLANLYDACHGVLLQYVDLLTSPNVIPLDEYAQKVLPPLTELSKTYGIALPICMLMMRPILNASILANALAMNEKERQTSEEVEKRLKAALTAKREPATVSRVGSPAVTESTMTSERDAKAAAQTEDVVMESSEVQPAQVESPWQPELYALFDEVKDIAPPTIVDIIGPGFYLTFWQLSTYDISPPIGRYEEENANLRALSRQEDSKYIAADRSSDRAKRLTAITHRTRRDRYNYYASLLALESKNQMIAHTYTKKRLTKERQHWFSHNPRGAVLASAIVEQCLHPRALLSPMDADYSAQIIKVIHLLGTPGFSTLNIYDKLLGEHVRVVIFTCSEYEARNYGRFLLGVLTDLYKWHQDEQLFMNDNRTKGGKVSYLPGFQLRFTPKSSIALEEVIKWPEFRRVCKKWHRNLLKCFIECIETGEFMHIYGALVVLKEILPMFPIGAVHEHTGPTLKMTIDKFLEKETRDDLKIFGRAVVAGLKKRESQWAPPKSAKVVPSSASSRPTPTGTPAPGERSRTTAVPTAPSADARRPQSNVSGTPTPSAPRALAQPNGHLSSQELSTAAAVKQAIESVPRPEVVKRVRPETRTSAPKANGDPEPSSSIRGEPMAVDGASVNQKALSKGSSLAPPTAPRRDEHPTPRGPSAAASRPPLPSTPLATEGSRPPTPSSNRPLVSKDLPQSPRVINGDPKARLEASQVMPPPVNPSQTSSAQELRDTAKASRSDRVEDKTRSSQQTSSPSVTTPTRHRSTSPASKPGTRNPSVESRGRSRTNTAEGERSEEKRSDRESRHEPRDGRREGRGDRSSRSARDSDRESHPERERERGRDRHGDRERPRTHDRERDRDEKRDRDRDRDRERERDRDRHRRDDKDRERESRKEREPSTRSSATAAAPTTPTSGDRGLPARPDASRRRDTQHDDSLGKRRRPAEDESERAAKRVSRKESHHEDRSRRTSEKDGHERPRESERRRKDRDPEPESRSLTVDTKVTEKRIPEGPASASRALPPTTPSAPRAMASNETSRSSKGDRDWHARDTPSQRTSPTGPSSRSAKEATDPAQSSGGSLRSRISEKEPSRSLPQGPARYRKDGDALSEGGRKRSSSEREVGDPSQGVDSGSAPSKRVKLVRNRYVEEQTKKYLSSDGEKGSRSRKD